MLYSPLEQPVFTSPPLLLLVGSNRDVLVHQLRLLAQQAPGPLVILVATDEMHYSDTLKTEILYHFKRECYRVGYYHQYWHYPPVDFLETSSLQLAEHRDLLLTCQSYVLNIASFSIQTDSTPTLEISPVMATIHQQLRQWGLKLNTMLLSQTLYRCTEKNEWFDLSGAWSELNQCVQQWCQLAPTDDTFWEGSIGAYYRYIQDLYLWMQPELQVNRNTLNFLMAQAHAQPDHWPLQAALLLYKRFCSATQALLSTVPQWFQALYQHYRTHNHRHLELLPEIKDETVTVLILTFNRLALLQRAVNSVLAQTYTQWKLIIGDGGSTDGTQAYGESLAAGDPRITYMWWDLPPGREGFHETQRRLFALPETEWVVIVPDDDWLEQAHLAKSMTLYRQYPWVAMVFGCYQMCDETQAVMGQYGPMLDSSGPLETFQALQQGPVYGLCPQGCLHRRSVLWQWIYPWLEQAAQYDNALGWDYLIAMELFGRFETVHCTEVLFYVHYSSDTYYSGADFTQSFLSVYDIASQGFMALFGKPYPIACTQAFLNKLLQPHMTSQFWQMFKSAENVTVLEKHIHTKQKEWLKFFQMFEGFLN